MNNNCKQHYSAFLTEQICFAQLSGICCFDLKDRDDDVHSALMVLMRVGMIVRMVIVLMMITVIEMSVMMISDDNSND